MTEQRTIEPVLARLRKRMRWSGIQKDWVFDDDCQEAASLIEQAKRLLVDRRCTMDHPRYFQWRDECDKWLEKL